MSIRVGVNPATIERAVGSLKNQALDTTDAIAARMQTEMDREIDNIISEENLVAKPKVGNVQPSPLRPYRQLLEVRRIPESDGDRVAIVTVPGITPEEEAKVAALEYGYAGYEIRVKNAKVMTGWEWNGVQQFRKRVWHPPNGGYQVMRRARDRVYARLIRGTV